MRWARRTIGLLRREFSVARWHTNPFQLLGTLILGIWSFMQITNGVTPTTVLDTQVDTTAQLFVSSTNLLGAIISLAGLHMRDLSSALWVEVIGYISLVGSLSIWIWLAAEKTGWLNTSYGYGLAIAFTGASLIRAMQIFLFKRAERRADDLHRLVNRVSDNVIEAIEDPVVDSDG